MSTNATLAAPLRTSKRGKTNPVAAGLPDPRPLTDYDVTYSEVAGNSRISVALKQPCIIRAPQWQFVDSNNGSSIAATTVTVVTSDAGGTIIFDFTGIIAASVNFVDVPYQDMQVQNFQGGFVRPGAKWFRSPK